MNRQAAAGQVFFIDEGQFEFAHLEREALFNKLLEHGLPGYVVEPVRAYQRQTVIDWVEVGLDDGSVALAPSVRTPPAETVKSILGSAGAQLDRAFEKDAAASTPPATADELLALLLTEAVEKLRSAKGGLRSPVRVDGLLPRADIARVGVEMLSACSSQDQPPGPYLIRLFEVLLDADTARLTASKEFGARRRASWLVAQGVAGPRKLARTLSVNASTTSRWLKDPEFQALVERRRAFIKRETERGTWPPHFQPGNKEQAPTAQ